MRERSCGGAGKGESGGEGWTDDATKPRLAPRLRHVDRAGGSGGGFRAVDADGLGTEGAQLIVAALVPPRRERMQAPLLAR